mgnify:CR=1 FL=1
MTDINPSTPMENLTPGGDIYTSGNAKEFKTMWLMFSSLS